MAEKDLEVLDKIMKNLTEEQFARAFICPHRQ